MIVIGGEKFVLPTFLPSATDSWAPQLDLGGLAGGALLQGQLAAALAAASAALPKGLEQQQAEVLAAAGGPSGAATPDRGSPGRKGSPRRKQQQSTKPQRQPQEEEQEQQGQEDETPGEAGCELSGLDVLMAAACAEGAAGSQETEADRAARHMFSPFAQLHNQEQQPTHGHNTRHRGRRQTQTAQTSRQQQQQQQAPAPAHAEHQQPHSRKRRSSNNAGHEGAHGPGQSTGPSGHRESQGGRTGHGSGLALDSVSDLVPRLSGSCGQQPFMMLQPSLQLPMNLLQSQAGGVMPFPLSVGGLPQQASLGQLLGMGDPNQDPQQAGLPGLSVLQGMGMRAAGWADGSGALASLAGLSGLGLQAGNWMQPLQLASQGLLAGLAGAGQPGMGMSFSINPAELSQLDVAQQLQLLQSAQGLAQLQLPSGAMFLPGGAMLPGAALASAAATGGAGAGAEAEATAAGAAAPEGKDLKLPQQSAGAPAAAANDQPTASGTTLKLDTPAGEQGLTLPHERLQALMKGIMQNNNNSKACSSGEQENATVPQGLSPVSEAAFLGQRGSHSSEGPSLTATHQSAATLGLATDQVKGEGSVAKAGGPGGAYEPHGTLSPGPTLVAAPCQGNTVGGPEGPPTGPTNSHDAAAAGGPVTPAQGSCADLGKLPLQQAQQQPQALQQQEQQQLLQEQLLAQQLPFLQGLQLPQPFLMLSSNNSLSMGSLPSLQGLTGGGPGLSSCTFGLGGLQSSTSLHHLLMSHRTSEGCLLQLQPSGNQAQYPPSVAAAAAVPAAAPETARSTQAALAGAGPSGLFADGPAGASAAAGQTDEAHAAAAPTTQQQEAAAAAAEDAPAPVAAADGTTAEEGAAAGSARPIEQGRGLDGQGPAEGGAGSDGAALATKGSDGAAERAAFARAMEIMGGDMPDRRPTAESAAVHLRKAQLQQQQAQHRSAGAAAPGEETQEGGAGIGEGVGTSHAGGAQQEQSANSQAAGEQPVALQGQGQPWLMGQGASQQATGMGQQQQEGQPPLHRPQPSLKRTSLDMSNRPSQEQGAARQVSGSASMPSHAGSAPAQQAHSVQNQQQQLQQLGAGQDQTSAAGRMGEGAFHSHPSHGGMQHEGPVTYQPHVMYQPPPQHPAGPLQQQHHSIQYQQQQRQQQQQQGLRWAAPEHPPSPRRAPPQHNPFLQQRLSGGPGSMQQGHMQGPMGMGMPPSVHVPLSLAHLPPGTIIHIEPPPHAGSHPHPMGGLPFQQGYPPHPHGPHPGQLGQLPGRPSGGQLAGRSSGGPLLNSRASGGPPLPGRPSAGQLQARASGGQPGAGPGVMHPHPQPWLCNAPPPMDQQAGCFMHGPAAAPGQPLHHALGGAQASGHGASMPMAGQAQAQGPPMQQQQQQ